MYETMFRHTLPYLGQLLLFPRTAAQPDPPPWALPGGGSDACAPPVDLAALVQLTAWIKVLGELIRKQDGEDSARFVDVRARAVSVLESWAQRWYDGQAMSTP